jgi:hypothetical protein
MTSFGQKFWRVSISSYRQMNNMSLWRWLKFISLWCRGSLYLYDVVEAYKMTTCFRQKIYDEIRPEINKWRCDDYDATLKQIEQSYSLSARIPSLGWRSSSHLTLPLVTRLAMLSLGSARGSSLVTRLALPLISSRPSRLDSRLASLGSPAKVGDELTVTAS